MTWVVRRALRWGSEKVAECATLASAEAHARRDILDNGNVGRIELTDHKTRTVYYDIHEEMT